MAFSSLLSLSLSFLVLFNGCFAQLEQQQLRDQMQWQDMESQQQHQLRAKTDCSIQRINAQEPNRRMDSEAGVTEIWENTEELECAGAAAVRHVIQPRGLLLPSYTNVPQLYYVIQGRGLQGTAIPGCPETFESSSESGKQESERQAPRDRHQKIRQIREGDVIALPAGVAHWAYNNGDAPLVCVALLDLGNDANQLDLNLRKFFLAGNPADGQQSRRYEREEGGKQGTAGNIFRGINDQLLADIFNVDTETARKMQGQDDKRGNIVNVDRELQVISPQYQGEEESEERERERERRANGLEETMCTMRIRENIGNPRQADVFNPRGGRVRTLNNHNLPILNSIQLSAERGVLYRNAILAPQWNINAHSVIYIIRGSGRLQIVGNSGKSMFDDRVREGQIVVVPQNFAVIKKADEQGLEWIAFKTNSNAMTTQLAGKLSAIRSMPIDVLANSYEISREDARNLKYNRDEMTVFSPGSRSSKREV